ncbi:MAG: ABC transporter permease, partial [Actinomycetota bacterium]|nr:ABC transporter permease [Actinomycetota bacterium]
RSLSRVLAPKEPIPRWLAAVLAFGGFALVGGIWAVLSYGGNINPFFLPTPGKVAHSLYDMFRFEGFAHDVWASTERIGLGFLLSAVIGIPLGIAIGSFRVVQAFFEPVIAAVRYMPASAFIPLLIIWFGIYEKEKVAVIFIGVFFPLTLMIADVSANVPRELVNIAYTLGASRWQVFWRVLLPASWPGVVDNLRIGIGWAWTYLIVAELVAASTGIGHVILTSSRFLETEKIIGGILTIGALGLLTDAVFRTIYRVLFPYAERLAR